MEKLQPVHNGGLKAERHTVAKSVGSTLMIAAQVGNQGEVAKALECMEYGHLCRGDYGNAYEVYEAVAVEYCKSDEAWVEERCRDNMAKIKRKQEEGDAVIGFWRLHMSVKKSLFYGPVQVSVGNAKLIILSLTFHGIMETLCTTMTLNGCRQVDRESRFCGKVVNIHVELALVKFSMLKFTFTSGGIH